MYDAFDQHVFFRERTWIIRNLVDNEIWKIFIFFFLITFILATEKKGPQSTIHMNEDLTTSGNVIVSRVHCVQIWSMRII